MTTGPGAPPPPTSTPVSFNIKPLAVTMGEPAGIGPEITLKAWALRHRSALPCFFAINDPGHLRRVAAALGLDVEVRVIDEVSRARSVFETALPVLPIELAARPRAGTPDPANGAAVTRSIERAVELALGGDAAAVVTNPIHKGALYDSGFGYSGHTDFLAALCAGPTDVASAPAPVMMLSCPGLRTAPVTVHVPLARVPGLLSRALIAGQGRILAAALARDFGISRPRVAVTGLNPHAGEDGAMGREDRDIIAPAIADLRAEGIAIDGPFPADSLFQEKKRDGYDAVLCMYHDQALIPVKTLDFARLVNITLGLPVVRTSPGHGTALDIAGTGAAGHGALAAALIEAAQIAGRRAA